MAIGPIARMAAQAVVLGISILSRALPAAYAQALNNAKKGGASAAAGAAKDGGFMARKVISRDEALQVLNLTEGEVTAQAVQRQYDKYFAANDVSKGGSFYLQSKVYRAKEMLDEFMKEKRMEEAAGGSGVDGEKSAEEEGDGSGAEQGQQQQTQQGQQQQRQDGGKKMKQ